MRKMPVSTRRAKREPFLASASRQTHRLMFFHERRAGHSRAVGSALHLSRHRIRSARGSNCREVCQACLTLHSAVPPSTMPTRSAALKAAASARTNGAEVGGSQVCLFPVSP